MYQKITVIGRLGRDPEIAKTPSGSDMCSFSIASDRSWSDRSGQKHKETTWFRVTVYDSHAQIAAKYFRKGKLILVEGRLRVDPQTGGPKVFKKRDGTSGAAFEIDAQITRQLSPLDGQQEPTSAEDVPF